MYFMVTVTYAEHHIKALYAESHYAECRYAERRYAECRVTIRRLLKIAAKLSEFQ
jgi:hypothetical protein